MRSFSLPFFLPLLLGISFAYIGSAQSEAIQIFDAFLETNRQKFSVPGCAVTVVKDGKVIFTKAYGQGSISAPGK